MPKQKIRSFSASELLDQFQKSHVVLFIGADVTGKELTTDVCRQNWGLVLTSSTTPDVVNAFSLPGRAACVYSPTDTLPKPLLNRKELPILSLFPTEEKLALERAEKAELDDGEFEGDVQDDALERLRELKILLNGSRPNHLVVMGYDPNRLEESSTREIPHDPFLRFLRRDVPAECVHFYGPWSAGDGYDKLCELVRTRGFTLDQESLAAQLSDIRPFPEAGDGAFVSQSTAAHFLYKDGRSVALPPENNRTLNSCWFATLLTEEQLNQVRPYGRILQERWFFNFLMRSSHDQPQWYGYLDNTEFYVPRHYEQALEILIRQELAANNRNIPIYLMGDPGSSKSVELGALAVHIYQEHKYPVIYIYSGNVNLSNGTEDFNILDELMQAVEHAGSGNAGRILLIWDCSSYRDVVAQAQDLTTALENRGRRFLLVCSAYSRSLSASKTTKYFAVSQDGKRLVETKNQAALVSRDRNAISGDSYWVCADRKMTELERKVLVRRLRDFSGISQNFLNQISAPNSSFNDLFWCMYEAIREIRPDLEAGLDRERLIVSNYVKTVLDTRISESGHPTTGNDGGMRTLFERHRDKLMEMGIDLDEISQGKEIEEEFFREKKQIDDLLERFNTCVAMFSRFKLNMPYSLAIHLLTPTDKGLSTEQREKMARSLYDMATRDLPWIRYEYDESMQDFVFAFRTTLEAQIFLRDTSGEKQIELTCDILEYIGNAVLNQEVVDDLLIRAVQDFLRYMGPNSRYLPFRGERSEEARDIQRYLNCVIDALCWLRTSGVPDRDGNFALLEITFRREYYGKEGWRLQFGDMPESNFSIDEEAYSKEWYERRLEALDQAVQLAQETAVELNSQLDKEQYEMSKSEENFLRRQCNGLEVESAICSLDADEVRTQYLKCCKELKMAPLPRWQDATLLQAYSMTFQRLSAVIRRDPANGYAYNALFKSFEREYQRKDLEPSRRYEYLAQIGSVVDDILFNGLDSIQGRGSAGSNELQTHIDTIRAYQSKTNISIEAIEQRDPEIQPFLELYDYMQGTGNPTAVVFVARLELPRLERTEDRHHCALGKKQRKRVGCVLRFLNKEAHLTCIRERPEALAFLLRVTWLYYEGAELDVRRECQVTHMTQEQWEHLRDLCADYIDLCRRNLYPAQNWAVLLYALTLIQSGDDYYKAYEELQSIRGDAFYNSTRMRVPFLLCGEDGIPWQFQGRVRKVKEKNGWMEVTGPKHQPPLRLGRHTREDGVRFHFAHLARASVNPGLIMNEPLELGLGYVGLTVYTIPGRKQRQEDSQ